MNQTELNTIVVFAIIWFGSLVTITRFELKYGEPEDIGGRPDYDENLDLIKVFQIVIGIFVLIAITSLIGKMKTGILYIPQPPPPLFALQTTAQTAIHNSFWQVFVVSPAEENLRLSLAVYLIKRLEGVFGESAIMGFRFNEVFGAGFPTIAWGMLHGQLAYAGDVISVVAAIVAGMVLYVFLQISNSLLVPVGIHAGYNIVVLLLSGGI